MCAWVSCGDGFERYLKVGVWFDAVELAGFEEGGNARSRSAGHRPSVILAPINPHSSLDVTADRRDAPNL